MKNNDFQTTDFKNNVKDNFLKKRGYWSDSIWGSMLNLDANFLDKYLEFSSVPFKENNISLKDKELLYTAFDVSATHLYEPGTEAHIRNALNYGATTGEVLEVIEIASLLGMQSMNYGAEILEEELQNRGLAIERQLSEEEMVVLKDQFIEENGYWNNQWEATLKISPSLFSAYLNLSESSHHHLSPKMREFVFLTINAAATHLNTDRIRIHIKRLLDLNATKEEIKEVLEISCTLSIHASTVSVPILEKIVKEK